MPMEDVLYSVANILARFDFSLDDYSRDDGESVVKKSIDFYNMNGGIFNEEIKSHIHRYIDCRYAQMRDDAIKWHRALPVLFSGDEISFRYHGTSVSGIVFVSPKRIVLSMKEPFAGLYDEDVLPSSVPIIFTQDLVEGSPANSEGIARAQSLLERLYFNHIDLTSRP